MGDEMPKIGLEKPADLPPDAVGQHRFGGAPETSSKALDDGRVIVRKAPRQAFHPADEGIAIALRAARLKIIVGQTLAAGPWLGFRGEPRQDRFGEQRTEEHT